MSGKGPRGKDKKEKKSSREKKKAHVGEGLEKRPPKPRVDELLVGVASSRHHGNIVITVRLKVNTHTYCTQDRKSVV